MPSQLGLFLIDGVWSEVTLLIKVVNHPLGVRQSPSWLPVL